jgi:hypothetical protein
MSNNQQASTVEAQRGIVRPHQPGQDVFRSVLPEEIDWEPFPSFPRSVLRRPMSAEKFATNEPGHCLSLCANGSRRRF